MAVASNGNRSLVTASLERTNLLSLFDTVVTIDDVTQGKPAPDIFLEAARRLNVEPERCFIFEDSEEGLEAASRAKIPACDVRLDFSGETDTHHPNMKIILKSIMQSKTNSYQQTPSWEAG